MNSGLENYVKNFKIFIDTCAWLDHSIELFLKEIVPILQQENKHIILPQKVYEELSRLCNDDKLAELAKKSIDNINILKSASLLKIYGDKNDNFADNVFLTVFTKYRLKYNLLLITRDNNLANDIINITKTKSVFSRYVIFVRSIDKNGNLKEFSRRTNKRAQSFNGSSEKIKHFPSRSTADVIIPVGKLLTISNIPRSGDVLFTDEKCDPKNSLRLIGNPKSGGEGNIFETSDSEIIAKIYKPEKLYASKHDKIKLMLSKGLFFDGICFPLSCLYNDKREFVGYTMRKAYGVELGKSIFIPNLLKKKFYGWTKKETIQLCITILKKIIYLHSNNIILGDINPANILIKSPTQVFFVDVDSYQIGGYPCPVGTINFTAPEIQRKKYDTFLRTFENEHFAIATLLFMIMLPGKTPYSLQGGESQIQNILNMDFPYPSGEKSLKKAPNGPWRYCWSHLPRFLKDSFYENFQKDGKYSNPKNRFSATKWLEQFEHYECKLDEMVEYDSMSIELFPSRLKKDKNKKYVTCKRCNSEVEFVYSDGFCQKCRKEKTLGIGRILDTYLDHFKADYLNYVKNKEDINRFNEELKILGAELKWYNANSEEKLNDNLTTITNEILALEGSLQKAYKSYSDVTIKLRELSKKIKTIWNPLNWWDKNQEKLRKEKRNWEVKGENYQKIISDLTNAISVKKSNEKNAKEDIIKYQSTNKEKLTKEINEIGKKFSNYTDKQKKLRPVIELYLQIEKIHTLNKNHEKKIKKIDSEIKKLKEFNDSLRNASTPAERYQIHSLCERVFGSGKPYPLIRERINQKREIKQAISKLWDILIPIEREINKTIKSKI